MNHLQDVRIVKDAVIETEVETRKMRSDCEREMSNLEKEESGHKNKMGEQQIQKKQIEQARNNFKVESEA